MQFYHPYMLILLVLLPLVLYLSLRSSARPSVLFSWLGDLESAGKPLRVRLSFLPTLVRLVCVALLVLALARPRQGVSHERVSTRGVAINLVVDRSGSMTNEMDYYGEQLNRLEVVKKVLADFVAGADGLTGRPDDLIGLVTFARYADTVCPLVHAHDALLGFLERTEIVQNESENATSIGDAIALAAARLDVSAEELARRNANILAQLSGDGRTEDTAKPAFEIQSKAIILLTDGCNNAGEHKPLAAAELAAKWGIKIYTIGIGSNVLSRRGLIIPLGSDLDENLLREIAQRTGGFYSRADAAESMRTVIEKIDQLEKSQIESIEYSSYNERFAPLALAALIALALEIFMSCVIFRKIP